jgi:hypothetical protein
VAREIVRFLAASNGERLVVVEGTWKQVLATIPEGLLCEVVVREDKPSRTDRQNRYFHALVEWWRKESFRRDGNEFTPDEAKEMFKRWLRFYRVIEYTSSDGRKVRERITLKTSNLDVTEFNDLLTLISTRTAEEWPDTTPPSMI